MNTATQLTLHEKVLPEVEHLLSREISRNEKLFGICEILADEIENFDWVGFYIADESGKDELVLGPYVGKPTDHTRIPFGRGICGQVAVSHQTFVSQDVHAEENYLSCSADVQSEIVVPIMKDGKFVAQIDIDSNTKNSITQEQKELLEHICVLLSTEF